MRAVWALAGGLLMLTAATDQSTDLDRATAGRVAGKPENCIDSQTAGTPEVIDNQTLVYRSAGRLWVNHLPDQCASLNDDVIIITDVQGGQLCRNDRFRTLQRGTSIPSAFCRLGAFVPYQRVKAPAGH